VPIPEKPLQARGGGGFTAAINDLGVIVGTSDEFAGQPTDRGLVWQKEAGGDYKLDITDLGGLKTYFYDINNLSPNRRPPHLRARSHPPALCRPGFHQPPTGFGRRHRYGEWN